MLRHYFALTFRRLTSAWFSSLLNALSLAVGLTCYLLAYAYASFWQSAEEGFPNAGRTYVLSMSIAFRNGGFQRSLQALTPERAAEHLRTDFPALERVARAFVVDRNMAIATEDRRAFRGFAVAVDPGFLDIFELPFVAGDPGTALAAPRSIVISEEFADRLFSDSNPLGKHVLIGNLVSATVTGVVDDIPEPSHLGRSPSAPLGFDFLVSTDIRDALRANAPNAANASPDNWLLTTAVTYVLLPEDGSLSFDSLRQQLASFPERHIPRETIDAVAFGFDLLPVGELLPRAVDAQLFLGGTRISLSTLLLILGGLVLLVASTNYANLETAKASRRAREVGLSKSLGAKARQITGQYLLEAGLLTTFALFIAVLLLVAAVSHLESLAGGTEVAKQLFSSSSLWLLLLATIIGVTVLAGGYPALVLAHIRPMVALRAADLRTGSRGMTTALVVAQFAITSFFLTAMVVLLLQNQKLNRIGADAIGESLVLIENRSHITNLSADTLRNELMRIPEVQSVTELGSLPWEAQAVNIVSNSPEPGSPSRRVIAQYVGYDFFSVFGLQVIAGRVFDPAYADHLPNAGELNIVVDRALVDELGFNSPEEAVGEALYIGGGTLQIIGVVETSRFTLTKDYGTSTIYRLQMPTSFNMAVRIAESRTEDAVREIDRLWSQLVPEVPIRRFVLSELFDNAYATFLRIGQGLTGLAVVALTISATGLFALASTTVGHRAREIAIRKVLGARKRQLVLMLLGSFAKPVVLANLIAWPFAFMAARAYLGIFIDSITLSVFPFALSLVLSCVVACFAVLGQTARATSTRVANMLQRE